MKKQIIINANKDRSRIAIVEDGELVELYVENPDNVRTIGNIYLGHVEKVMPTLRAAFVDIGEKQDAFLHFSDLTDNFPQLLAMSGEDVPGLDEPVLALAPQKRIADDATEPDVEDALEVEPAEETPETSRSRSTRSRRSRGRGGRSRSGGSEEEEEQEEEQEEAGEGKKSSRGVFVLDLSSKPTRAAASPDAPKAASTEPSDAAPAAETTGTTDDAEAPAPKKRAPRAKKKVTAEAPDAAVDETPAETAPKKRRSRAKKTDDSATTEPTTEAQPAADAEAPPKKRAPRKSRAKKDVPAYETETPVEEAVADAVAEMVVETPDAVTAAEETASQKAASGRASDDETASDETTARPRRRPRGRADKQPSGTQATDSGRAARARDETSSPRDAEPADDASTPDDSSTAEERPRSRRKNRASEAPPAADADTPEAVAQDEPEERPRSRRSTRSSRTEAPAADPQSQKEDTADETPRRPRGTMTIDLTSSAKKTEPSSESPRARAPSRAEVDNDSDVDDSSEATDRPRSRRRTRGQEGRRAEAPDAPAAESDTSDADATPEPTAGRDDERPRSRRGRRTGSDDAGTQAPARTEKADDADETESRSSSGDTGRSPSSRGDSGRNDSSRSGSRNGDASRRSETKSGREVSKRRVPLPSNEQLLRRGGNVIVKVTKEPISAKGSRVSTDISLAGRFLVLVPAADYVAVSKKIESARERKRLRTLAQSLKPDNCGVIVRTVAEGQDAKSLDTDLRLLIDKWRSIEAKLDGGKAKAPVLLYEDVNMVSSIIRDLFSEDFDRILVDDPKVFKNVQAYVRAVAPDMADKVELHRGSTPVYRAAGLEKQVEEAFSRRVNMKGGGYLFIETTEAMHVVDVNSGRAGRGKSQKENLIAVNVEAAREVAKQLRLRDLGGIIVVDFIDLRLESDRRKVTNALLEGFAKDRAVTKLLPMSDFGLVQITRQRLRPSITAQPEGDEPDADPAERAARAGAGEIAPTPGRRGRDDDRRDDGPSGRDLDAGTAVDEARDLLDASEDRASRRPDRSRDDRSRDDRSRDDRSRDDRSRDDRSRDDRSRDDRGDRSRRGRTRDAEPTEAAPDDREPASPEPATTPEATTARLRAWLDVYRKTVDPRYRDRPVVIVVHPLFLAHLQRGLVSTLTRWRLGIRSIPWRVEADPELEPLSFDIRDEKSTRSLLKKYTP